MSGYSIVLNATLTTGTPPVGVGQCLVWDPVTGTYLIATSANRGTKRTTGIAITLGDANNRAVEMLTCGLIEPAVSLLGLGAALWVRISTLGFLERVTTPSGTDDVVGWTETDGTVHALFGVITVAMATGTGGGGGFTPPTGTGPVKVSGGALVGAATKILLSDTTNDVTGLLPLANQAAPTGSGMALVSAGSWVGAALAGGTSGNIAISDGTTWTSGAPDSAANVGSGAGNVFKTKSGAQFQFKTLLAGSNVTITDNASDITIASSGGGAFTPPTGTGFVTVTSGALDAASLAFPLLVAKGGTGATTFGTAGILHGSGTSAVTCSLIVNADVSASAAIAASKLAPPGATTNVIWNSSGAYAADASFTYDGSGGASLAATMQIGGGTMPSVGYLRFAYNGGAAKHIISVKDSAAANQDFLSYGSGDAWTMGNTAQNLNVYAAEYWTLTPSDSRTFAGSTYFIQDYNSSAVRFSHTTTQNTCGLPIVGDTGATSPWSGCNGDAQGGSAITITTNHTMTASEYSNTYIEFTTSVGAITMTMTFPAPGSAAQGYFKIIRFTSTGGTGTPTLFVKTANDGGSGISIGTNKTAIIWFGSASTVRCTADV